MSIGDNVIPFARHAVEPPQATEERFPIDISGSVPFERLARGLATVGLSVRYDARSKRVVIVAES